MIDFWDHPGQAIAVVVLGCALFFALLIMGAMKLDEAGCHARWRGSQYAARWSAMGGCQIEIEPGRWIPADTTRQIEVR